MTNYYKASIAVAIFYLSIVPSMMAAENKPLVIQSQVKGTQEQPNVIYIMPWQGVEDIIEVKGKSRTIKLPTFNPVHPKAFKEQVSRFSSKQLTLKKD